MKIPMVHTLFAMAA